MFDLLPGDKGFLQPKLASNPVFKRFNSLEGHSVFKRCCVLPGKPILVRVLSVNLWVFTSPEIYWDNVEARKPIAKELLGVVFSNAEDSMSWSVLAEDFVIAGGY
jgi:hypothetical protein